MSLLLAIFRSPVFFWSSEVWFGLLIGFTLVYSIGDTLHRRDVMFLLAFVMLTVTDASILGEMSALGQTSPYAHLVGAGAVTVGAVVAALLRLR